MNVVNSKKSIVTKVLVLVLAIVFTKVLFLVSAIVFTSIVNIPVDDEDEHNYKIQLVLRCATVQYMLQNMLRQ